MNQKRQYDGESKITEADKARWERLADTPINKLSDDDADFCLWYVLQGWPE